MKKALWAATSVAFLCGTVCATPRPASAAVCELYVFFPAFTWPHTAHAPYTTIYLDCKVTSGGGTGPVTASSYYKPPTGPLINVGVFGDDPAIGSSGFVRITSSTTDTYRGPVGQYKLEIYFEGQFVNDPGDYRPSPPYGPPL
jgi:hypothetical protein